MQHVCDVFMSEVTGVRVAAALAVLIAVLRSSLGWRLASPNSNGSSRALQTNVI